MERVEWIRGYAHPREVGGSLLAQQFVCREQRSGQEVALRLIRAPHVADRSMVNRMLRDSRLIQGLRQHAHVARVIDVGESDREIGRASCRERVLASV